MSLDFITYSLCAISYSLLFVAEAYTKGMKIHSLQHSSPGSPGTLLLQGKQLFCILVMAMVSFYWFLFTENSFLLNFPMPDHDWQLIFFLPAALAITVGYNAAKKLSLQGGYYIHLFSLQFKISYLINRTLFLVAYEIFFRGVLLFTCIRSVGENIAIVINILLYALLHRFNRKEFIGSIPFGMLLCVLTIMYQSIWPAVFIHLCLSLSHEITLLINYKSPIKTIRL